MFMKLLKFSIFTVFYNKKYFLITFIQILIINKAFLIYKQSPLLAKKLYVIINVPLLLEMKLYEWREDSFPLIS